MTKRTDIWDVIVVGAGPAGSIAALMAARRGLKTLLVDRAQFPRTKVCGSCLNEGLLELLRGIGLDAASQFPTAPTLKQATFNLNGRAISFPLPGGIALSREAFDHWLVQECIRSSVDFLPETSARIGPCTDETRSVILIQGGAPNGVVHHARTVVCATGLTSSAIDGIIWKSPRWRKNRIGIGAVLDEDFIDLDRHEIFLNVRKWGYAGLVRLEDNRIDFAAAVDPQFIRRCGSPNKSLARMIEGVGRRVNMPPEFQFRGTPPLTRHARQVGLPRLFLVGDAAGYAEPFTGEGMHWAVLSSAIASDLVAQCATGDDPIKLARQWQALWKASLGGRWKRCLFISQVLRFPRTLGALSGMIPAPDKLKQTLASSFSGQGNR
ncbi:MAG: NAD(P)/FAD-dependent oxidoreductase [Candidatus Sumerlaeia bacterium]|nr:NAD(P)/FAD-dependent oxidoreductase [Candidatus Sumerlaeia bacterium]